ncbi:MAG: type I restriction enzyme HsdR N-terminal domain-containing protein [Muribaculaceae bacterium]|nr:type I restriction enzyme HsdR N-terminal domain-containing protein [Muribaculaceae bacterium]
MANQVFNKLNLPPATLQLRNEATVQSKVYDVLRKKFVTLTPEEWVRQHFTSFLIGHLGYPAGLMANEVSIELNGTARRCDTVVYDRNAHPVMIVEYKAPSVAITQETFNQIVRYNMVLKVRWLIVTNGMNHYCCRIDYSPPSYNFVEQIPFYDAL